jgi:hypothetical protein
MSKLGMHVDFVQFDNRFIARIRAFICCHFIHPLLFSLWKNLKYQPYGSLKIADYVELWHSN